MLRYRRFTAPRPDGLPAVRVLIAFVLLVCVVGAILVAFALNGTSSGVVYPDVHTGKDPSLLAGQPERIRSDEWNVGVPWTISQLQHGLPSRSPAFPGGSDVDIPFGLPSYQPIVAAEPQELGFLFLDAGRGYAWKWWVPGLALIAACFALMLTLLPRRPLVAAGLAVGFFFSPFFQWWYEPAADWPIVWGAATLTAIIWALRSATRRGRLALTIPVAYLTAVMAVGIYAPFIIPVVFVVLFAGIGLVIAHKGHGAPWRDVIIRLLPIGAAGVVGIAVVLLWLRAKASVIAAFTGTVYPGQRLTPTGERDWLGLTRAIGSSFSESLKNEAGFLGINSSEASTFFLLGVFLLPVGVWIAVRRRRSRAGAPWLTISLLAFLALILAFMLVPGWNALAHVLFLDLSNGTRMRIGVGFASFVLVGSIAKDLDDDDRSAPKRLAIATIAAFALSQIAIAVAVDVVQGPARLWQGSPLWPVYTAVSCAAIYLFARRRPMMGMAAFLALSVFSSASVNPVYVGVLDLRNTAVSRTIVTTNAAAPKNWVGIGGLENSLLMESGVTAYNGTQGAPSVTMWNQIDPGHKYVKQWNRLADVVWTKGVGEPEVTNPAEDLISVTFDACSRFAQTNVGYVLSDSPISSPCLTRDATFVLPRSTATIYSVTPHD